MKKIICILFLLLTCAYSFGQVTVEVRDEQSSNANVLGLRLRVNNNTGKVFSDVDIKYSLKKNSSETWTVDSYYTENWTVAIAEQYSDRVVLNIHIPTLARNVQPNESGISVGIHRTDWKSMSKTSANGFPQGSSFSEASEYTVYTAGTSMIGGKGLSGTLSKIRFVGVQPEASSTRSAWVEIENYGTAIVDLNQVFLKWPSSDGTKKVTVSSAKLQPGARIRVCKSSTLECPNDDVIATIPTLPMSSAGEMLLLSGSDIVDYLSWGKNAGVYASDARAANVHYISIRYDLGNPDEYWHYVQNGIFYKFIDGKWRSYAETEDANTQSLPAPISYMNVENMYMPANATNRLVRFAWHPVEDAVGYKLIVKKSNGTLVAEQYCTLPFYDMYLGIGEYSWSVITVYKDEVYSVSSSWKDHYQGTNKKIIKRESGISNEHYLQVPAYAVHKDTRMLVPNWGENIVYPEISWDHADEFVYNSRYDYGNVGDNTLFLEVSWRCWAVGVQMINAYYGGDLTQDEIKYHGKTAKLDNIKTAYGIMSRAERDHIIAPFGLGSTGGTYAEEQKMVLMWGMQMTDQSKLDSWYASVSGFYTNPQSLNEADVKKYINAKRPMYVAIRGHIMVLDGYRNSSDGFQIHLVNLYNGGEKDWFLNSSVKFVHYFVPPANSNPRKTDSRVHKDSDGDCIVDFDEDERFHTNKLKKDSDGDGIEDKVEIKSYTMKEPFVLNGLRLGDDDNTKNAVIYRYEIFADIDGDGKRAELDIDSDHAANNGLKDGQEDLNHNGYVDKGERDPYDETDDKASSVVAKERVFWDAPAGVAIYAYEGVNIGDNVTCNSTFHGYCDIVSESNYEYYSVYLGENTVVGNVKTKGGIVMMKGSDIVGSLGIYSKPVVNIVSDRRGDNQLTGGETNYSLGAWPYLPSDSARRSIPNLGSKSDLVVQAGQTKTINSNTSLRSLTVESGATLKLGPCVMEVGHIDLKPGSKVEFTAPGNKTLIYADGYINWNASIVNTDLRTVAKGFKLIQYNSYTVNIDGDWAGTLFARWSYVNIGAEKNVYGRFVVEYIYIGSGTVFNRVDYAPVSPNVV